MTDRLRTSPSAVLAVLAAVVLLAPGVVSCSSSTTRSGEEEGSSPRVEAETQADTAPGSELVDVTAPEPPAEDAPEAATSTEDTPSIARPADPASAPTDPMTDPQTTPTKEVATLGAGCFWCIEAVLEQVDGVESVVSGYMGGETLNPTYREICTGRTGHAEVVQITFDPTVLSYKDLLDWFWRLHDPTTLNRQGADRGTQYRSAIFTHSDEQARIAATSKKDVQPTFSDPIVTEITPASTFYEAEDYHQGYYFDNTGAGYCRAVIAPKLKKLGLKY